MQENEGLVRIRIMTSRLGDGESVTGGSRWTGKPRGVGGCNLSEEELSFSREKEGKRQKDSC